MVTVSVSIDVPSLEQGVAFYSAAILAVVDLVVYWYGGATGLQILAFIAVLVLCGLAMFRIWRDQHHYL